MNITIKGDISPKLDARARQAFNEKITKFCKEITHAHIIFKTEHLDHIVEATAHLPGKELFAKAKEMNMGKSLDVMVDRMVQQIKKYRDKRNDHRGESE
ncbi:MAG: ribosome-associated translation inhibitor RaiA [Gammaproteobacteria bacterium]|nr:ribosome-associated translation inhibitor RaiA [Gammaproteobacteria bacterium]